VWVDPGHPPVGRLTVFPPSAISYCKSVEDLRRLAIVFMRQSSVALLLLLLQLHGSSSSSFNLAEIIIAASYMIRIWSALVVVQFVQLVRQCKRRNILVRVPIIPVR